MQLLWEGAVFKKQKHLGQPALEIFRKRSRRKKMTGNILKTFSLHSGNSRYPLLINSSPSSHNCPQAPACVFEYTGRTEAASTSPQLVARTSAADHHDYCLLKCDAV